MGTYASDRQHKLEELLWEARHREDQFLGDLLNAYLEAGSPIHASRCGETYIDVGTLAGYHTAQDFLRGLSCNRTLEAA